MQAYCGEVALIPNHCGHEGLTKRLLQLRELNPGRGFPMTRKNL